MRAFLRRRGRAALRTIVVAWRDLAQRDLPAEMRDLPAEMRDLPGEMRSRAQLLEALRAQEGCTARLEARMLGPWP